MAKTIKDLAEEFIDKTPREILDELSEIFQKMKMASDDVCGKYVFRQTHDYLMQYFVNQGLIKILDNLKKNEYLYAFTKGGVTVVRIHDHKHLQQQES